MTSHSHDTDRILAVLGEAIETLRQPLPSLEDPFDDGPYFDFFTELTAEIANDLALLHGAVSAEAQRHDEQVLANAVGLSAYPRLPHPKPKDIDVKRSEAGRRMFLHREELEAEVARHEHDDEERGIR